MRISDWSSDVCSSDLIDGLHPGGREIGLAAFHPLQRRHAMARPAEGGVPVELLLRIHEQHEARAEIRIEHDPVLRRRGAEQVAVMGKRGHPVTATLIWLRSEEHTSELQSLMRISYAVFCLKKKK